MPPVGRAVQALDGTADLLALAAEAASINPVDGPFANFRNPDAYREKCKRSMILGWVGN